MSFCRIGKRSIITPPPALLADFVTDSYLSVLSGAPFAYARTGGGTVYGSDGTIQTVASNVLPITYDPVTRQRLGFLRQEGRTNLYQSSTDFTANWTATRGALAVASGEAAPTPSGIAYKFAEDATTGAHFAAQTISYVSGTTYSWTVIVKAAERTFVRFQAGSGGTAFPTTSGATQSTLNLSNGAVTAVGASLSNVAATALGGGWWQMQFSATAIATVSESSYAFIVHNGSGTSYAGTDGSGVLVAAAQCEAGAFPSSLIVSPTGSQATRAQDSLSITGSAFSGLWNASGGTLLVRWSWPAFGGSVSTKGVSISDGTTNNRIYLMPTSAGRPQFRAVNAASTDGAIDGGATLSLNVPTTYVLRMQANNYALWADGSLQGVDTAALMPTVSALYAGAQSGTLADISTIQRLAYWRQPLSDAQCARLSR